MNKKIMLPTISLLVIGASIFGVQSALAANGANGQTAMVEKIATRFNLDQSEVQKVFDEQHAVRKAEMETKNTERLSKLVAEGKITEAQKTLILNKQKELSANRPDKTAMKNLTPEERKSQMDAKKAEMESWAKANGIDTKYLMFHGGGRGLHGYQAGK